MLWVVSFWWWRNCSAFDLCVIPGNEVIGKDPLGIPAPLQGQLLLRRSETEPEVGSRRWAVWPDCSKSSEQATLTVLEFYFYF